VLGVDLSRLMKTRKIPDFFWERGSETLSLPKHSQIFEHTSGAKIYYGEKLVFLENRAHAPESA
jgi:hypothetical protein